MVVFIIFYRYNKKHLIIDIIRNELTAVRMQNPVGDVIQLARR